MLMPHQDMPACGGKEADSNNRCNTDSVRVHKARLEAATVADRDKHLGASAATKGNIASSRIVSILRLLQECWLVNSVFCK